MLQSVAFTGGRRRIVKNQLPFPTGIALFGDNIFWVDKNIRSLLRMSKLEENGTNVKIDSIKADLENLRDVAIFDASTQPKGKVGDLVSP